MIYNDTLTYVDDMKNMGDITMKYKLFLDRNASIYDFHTHISSKDELAEYINQGIYPVVNCRTLEEYNDLASFDGEFSLSLGIHPWDSDKVSIDGERIFHSNTGFVGEIGMDSCWCDVDIHTQEKIFLQEIDRARDEASSVILHTKGMEKRILDIISAHDDLTYIVHWYSCDYFIDEYISTGAYFTIGLAVKYEEEVRKLVEKLPLERILYETDGIDALKWLTEKDILLKELRGVYVDVVEEISKIKDVDIEKIHNHIVENSRRLLQG